LFDLFDAHVKKRMTCCYIDGKMADTSKLDKLPCSMIDSANNEALIALLPNWNY